MTRNSRLAKRRVRPDNCTPGFTLIELLVVLAIIAVMLTIAVPRYYNQLESSKEAVLRENLRATRDVLDKFFADTGKYPDSMEELVERKYLRSLPIDPLTESSTTWIVVSVPDGYRGAVFDLHSSASGTGKNGVPYGEW